MIKDARRQADYVWTVSWAPLSKFTFFPLAAVACVVHRAKASEGGIFNVDSPAYEHPMLCDVLFI